MTRRKSKMPPAPPFPMKPPCPLEGYLRPVAPLADEPYAPLAAEPCACSLEGGVLRFTREGAEPEVVRLQDLLETEGEACASAGPDPLSFVLTLQGGARHVFRAESKADLQRWVRRSAMPLQPCGTPPRAAPPSSQVSAVQSHRNYTKWRRTMSSLRPDADAPLQSELLVGSGAEWRRHRAWLDEGRMRFKPLAGSAALLGLGETAVAYGDIEKIVLGAPAEFGFDLVTPSGTHKFRAIDKASFFLWIDALQHKLPRPASSLVSATV